MQKAATTQSPPPYTANDDSSHPNDLLNRLRSAVRRERTASDAAILEAERLRNFLLFTLSLDYHRNTKISLSCSDREHYAALHSRLNDLYNAHDHTDLTSSERETLAPYFWMYLHEPCKVLAIPVECAVGVIVRFHKFQHFGGRYKGSVYGVLHTQGIQALAEKLYMDLTMIIPRVTGSKDLRKVMGSGLQAIARLFFESISGIESSTSAAETNGGWDAVQTFSYELTARGKSYEARRNDTLAVARQNTLSLKHWAYKMKVCTSKILQRREVFPKGKAFSDASGTWKGSEPRPEGTAPDSHLWRRPYGWVPRTSVHIPDFFEHRPGKNCCDA